MSVSSIPDVKHKCHPDYYLEDGNITFLVSYVQQSRRGLTGANFLQVENDLFCIHRHFFIWESEVFRNILSIPARPDVKEGDSDDKPIVLKGIKSIDFGCLMWMWYDV
jgi:hypothetical protein